MRRLVRMSNERTNWCAMLDDCTNWCAMLDDCTNWCAMPTTAPARDVDECAARRAMPMRVPDRAGCA